MPVLKIATPKNLQPYTSLGVDLTWQEGGDQAVGDCPFCLGEGKFSVEIATSKFRCWSCRTGNENGGGNSSEFVKTLHRLSVEAMREEDYAELVKSRKLLSSRPLVAFGAALSIITKEWVVPLYGIDGEVKNLLRYNHDAKAGKRILKSTSGLNVHMLGVPLLLPSHEEVWIVESWNALALWETLGLANDHTTGVIGVPGCNVFNEAWWPLFSGKRVVLAFDNDHPKKNRVTGAEIPPAGNAGAQRSAALLSNSESPPESIYRLVWGPDGYDPELESGWDIRDALTQSASTSVRVKALEDLRTKVEECPAEWTDSARARIVKVGGGSELQPSHCSKWSVLLNAWRQALRMRQEIEDVLSVMLAVAASTSQVGDQLFLQVVADAGSSKTKLCDAMLVSKHCFALEHMTGFHSGWKGEGGEDCSLISRINHKTLITPEGDVMMSSPHFGEIMSQQRRIFDGKSGAIYKNTSEDKIYTGLRTPWIMAGTPALLDSNQSRLGDRFLKVFIKPPADEEKKSILKMVGYSALRSVVQTSNGDATTSIEGSMREAFQLTGGYIDYLRENMETLISLIGMDEDWLVEECADLAEFAAAFRARPAPIKRDSTETHDTKELPSRLTHQFIRLACCLTVVLNKKIVDDEVLRIVRKVAVDTASGRTLEIARHLLHEEEDQYLIKSGGVEGRFVHDIAVHANMADDPCKALLRFMRSIDIATPFKRPDSNQVKWRVTEKMSLLFKKVMGDPSQP